MFQILRLSTPLFICKLNVLVRDPVRYQSAETQFAHQLQDIVYMDPYRFPCQISSMQFERTFLSSGSRGFEDRPRFIPPLVFRKARSFMHRRCNLNGKVTSNRTQRSVVIHIETKQAISLACRSTRIQM